MSIMSHDGEDRPKSKVILFPLTSITKTHTPTTFFAVSRLSYFSFVVIVIFIVCIVQEFIFILNLKSYSTSSSSLENYITRNGLIKRWHKSGRRQPNNDWSRVTDGIYVYSAFWDTRIRNQSFIRIIGGATVSTAYLNSTKCIVKYSKPATIIEVTAYHTVLIEHHNEPSRALYFRCHLNASSQPDYVSVVTLTWDKERPVEWIAVQSLEHDKASNELGVCVRPMYNFTDVFRIAEFIAYYEALGVSHFTFYVYSIPENITDFLQELINNKYSIDVLDWSLPMEINTMWELGQLASINDCIYRHMKNLAYLTIADLDEFVTPRHVMTLQEVLKKQDNPKKKIASFVFRSSVFCAEYEQDILPPVIPTFLTQSSIRRQSYVYPFYIRSKYIVKPTGVVTAGVHFVWSAVPGWDQKLVPYSQTLVHHYRSEICLNEQKHIEKCKIDVTSRKYLNKLMRGRAIKIWSQMF